MREYLNRQMQEKEERKRQEEDVNKKQSTIWKKDVENYMDHEQKKSEYVKMVNKKHADILKQQMQEKTVKGKSKMNKTELLQNKDRLREIAEKIEDVPLRKAGADEVDRWRALICFTLSGSCVRIFGCCERGNQGIWSFKKNLREEEVEYVVNSILIYFKIFFLF